MNIIFDTENIDELKRSNVLLELDTFYFSKIDRTVTSYCVVENIKIDDLVTVDQTLTKHEQMMQAYKDQQFDLCLTLVQQLTGSFGGELDSFYHELQKRIQQLTACTLPDDWSAVLVKHQD
jgi:hypothetical protein